MAPKTIDVLVKCTELRAYDALRDIMKVLTTDTEHFMSMPGYPSCFFCYEEAPNHKANCCWQRAKALCE